MPAIELSARIAGVDEAGRGPLAGSVVAAAVILNPAHPIAGLRDSKKLSPRRRAELARQIRSGALAWAVGRASVEEIDAYNILQASLLAMRRAISQLQPPPCQVLVDGTHDPQPCLPVTTIPGGDNIEPCISAASILAKECRDEEMRELDRRFPGYGLAQHKGYPTREHLVALARLGPSPMHRRSFAPVRRLLDA